ncbi:MAG: magnesium-translocating P-type ATPase [Armatimonadota bacterium]|nr:magnesium-translocating P-type ATPase [Armatimonadota bacterium]MDR7507908.1 magnesium-translocating P-type ATPase [Armatimonadota bacterium]MDR7510265.1 magnesium-translocating P-type ATPase [Armatimonadota bacterium]MDR7517534.1 magnesium-translocating P-type ATPase [Armatimonadota bacterium]
MVSSAGPEALRAFWSMPTADVLSALQSSVGGLGADSAAERLARVGPNVLGERKRSDAPALLLRQVANPLVMLLVAAAVLSFALQDPTDGAIILGIVAVSALLGFWQERGAATVVEKLLATVAVKASVLRGGRQTEVAVDELVPGDVVLLSAGSRVPADCLLLAAQDLFVDEASLTGESFPVEKRVGPVAADAPLARRANVLFLGTHVVSGSGRALVVRTGRATEFGRIYERLRLRPPETEFEHGVRRFGYLLTETTLVLVVAIFAFNVYLARPVLDSFLFALALAVGLTPQLLPAIISVNLAHGARRMAERRVIVKRLSAIENLGSMDVLCSDKTGTLTEGRVRVHAALDPAGRESERVLFSAYLNAAFQTAFRNPIDQALLAHRAFALDGWRKLDEVPYDFARRRLSVLAEHDGRAVLITKGALENVLDVCTRCERADGTVTPLADARAEIEQRYAALSADGYRVLGVALREMASPGPIGRDSEREMTFLGLLVFADPPKPGAAATVAALGRLGVRLKVITGDNALVAARVWAQVGLPAPRVLTGSQVHALRDDALPVVAGETDIFAEVEPNQKERLVRALRKAGHVVGCMGDGINDVPALHAADVSLSVQGAVDVAKEAADIVLLETDLAVLEAGVREGRRTFANTLKYVFMATSANFGNMFSMAGASLLLPFLPLLPKQILLTNLLTDIPELAISSDRVDADWIERPRRWDTGFIRRFMLTFGLVSSLFDYLTFGVLLWVLRAGAAEFRTGWFVESVVSAALIVLVVRTRGSFLRSRPGRALAGLTVAVAAATPVIPSTPLGAAFGFVPLPPVFLALMGLIVLGYIGSAELAKRWFYRGAHR